MMETKKTPPFYPEDINLIESPLPFTASFNLEAPDMIDLNLLNRQEKETLLRELEKRQNSANIKTSWTKNHVNLLLTLRAQLNKDQTDTDYIPLKDRPRR